MLKLTESAIGMLVSKYRAVLKNMRSKGAALALAGCLFLVPSSVSMAEEIVYPDDGTPLQNVANIPDSLAPSGSAGGISNSLTGNIITVKDGSLISGAVFGAVNFMNPNTVSANTVIIKGGTISMGTASGIIFSTSGTDAITASNNKLQISGGTIGGSDAPFVPGVDMEIGSVGGLAFSVNALATANDNTVEISGGTFGTPDGGVDSDIMGGMAGSEKSAATANNNTVKISGGTFDRSDVTGGMAASIESSATANNNKVQFSDVDKFTRLAYFTGGSAYSSAGAAAANDNTIEISRSTLISYPAETGDLIIGGDAYSTKEKAEAKNNKITIAEGTSVTLSDNITGGLARSDAAAIATGNTVTIDSSTVTIDNPYDDGKDEGSVTGGFAQFADETGTVSTGTATANLNTVTIKNSTIDAESGVHGGKAKGYQEATANDNTITITDNTIIVRGNVTGGYGDTYGAGTANNNKVTIINSEVKNSVQGADIFSHESGAAADNIVSISAGTVNGKITGADIYSKIGTVTTTNNTVSITNNSIVTGNISGGYAESQTGASTSANNTIKITDSTVNGYADGYIEGGTAASVMEGASTVTNNAVEINNSKLSHERILGGTGWSRGAGEITAGSNTVSIAGSEFTAIETVGELSGIAGGQAWNEGAGAATVNDNIVNITESTINGNMAGGVANSYEGTGSSNRNTVNVTNSTITTAIEAGIFGGVIWSEGAATASENIVNINGATINGDVEGGSAESKSGDTTANNNTVNINGTSIKTVSDAGEIGNGLVTGGGASSAEVGTGTASYNTVNINLGTIDGNIESGYASSKTTATTNNNTVNITESTLNSKHIYGGRAIDRMTGTGKGIANDNTVNITNSKVNSERIYGANISSYESATATNNIVNIIGGTINAEIAGADIYSETGTVTANYNTVNINGSTVECSFVGYGGITGGFAESYTGATTANYNTVNVNGATIEGGIMGGGVWSSVSGAGTASNNTVNITNSYINGDIIGGYVFSNDAATANNNTVNINGTTSAGTVSGGKGTGDVFTGNTLNINSETAHINRAENFEIVNFNYTGQVNIGTLDTGQVNIDTLDTTTYLTPIKSFSVMPAGSAPPSVILNTNDNNIDFNGKITGAGSVNKTGAGNLTLAGGNTNDISGTLNVNSGGLYIGDTASLTVGDKATFANGTTLGVGISTFAANEISIGNDVTFDITNAGTGTIPVITSANNIEGNFNQFLVGGVEVDSGQEPSLEKFLNVRVDVEDKNIDIISDGLAWKSTAPNTAHGHFSVKTIFTLNEILENNTATEAYFAGWDGKTLTKTGEGTLVLTNAANDYTGNTNINSGTLIATNTGALGRDAGTEAKVNISENAYLEFNLNSGNSGSFEKQILGAGNLAKTGYGELTLSGVNTYTGQTELREGTLTLSGEGTISDKLSLYGGTIFKTGGKNADYLSQVNVYGSAQWDGNLSMKGKTMNFYLPGTTEKGDIMLIVSNNADISNSTINVGIQGNSSILDKGDSVILINAETLEGAPVNARSTGQGMQGVTLRYEFGITKEENQLLANVISVKATEYSKPLSEGKLSGLVSVNQGQDFIAEQGIGNAVQSANGQGTSPFAAIGYGNTRHKTGSHIDSSGWSMVIGVAKENPDSGTTYGFFLEGGRGNYDTFNSFASSDVNGNGKNKYFGGGILLRKNAQDSGSGYNYHEGSLRLGRVTTDFSSNIAELGYGDTKSTYYGAHYGFGQIKKQDNGASRDIYGKLFYTHQGGDSITLDDGNLMEFSSAKSFRARLGILFTTAPSASGTSFSYGLAYEHEFDGKQESAINTVAVDSPSMKGGSAIATLGLNHQKAGSNFSMGLDLNGYAGKRQGLGVNAKFKWAF